MAMMHMSFSFIILFMMWLFRAQRGSRRRPRQHPCEFLKRARAAGIISLRAQTHSHLLLALLVVVSLFSEVKKEKKSNKNRKDMNVSVLSANYWFLVLSKIIIS
jgi:preprotein translocase subunit YajC